MHQMSETFDDTIQVPLNWSRHLENKVDQQWRSFICKNNTQDTNESYDTMRHGFLDALTWFYAMIPKSKQHQIEASN